jgi:hypothetical protein
MTARIAFLAFGVLVGGIFALAWVGAALDDRTAQRAIIEEFVSRYCHPDASLSEAFRMGDAAALSRVSIKSGLQPIAWAEYLKCKAGL